MTRILMMADAARTREPLGWSTERSDLQSIVADARRRHAQRFGDAQRAPRKTQ